ncbi:putative ankyrin repeat protein RF_0381 [Coccinella septempunctata]|uniref:putative ankyrin repeat protein RF_0381 n=1 Tax=Coccinella septempunctata TaxID=41139 RepID=UPI001D0607D4|nr:putative ankyrin repeat protein RF_0381 [Coccinella septempunctata]
MQMILRNKDSALIIEFLKHVKDNDDINMIHGNSTALYIAVERKLKDVVEYIVGRDADMNKKFNNGSTPLHESIKSESVDITKILLQNGADIEVKNKTGETPLHLAVKYNNPDQVRTLIINGADVNATDAEGATPLHALCFKKSFNFEMYELLLEKCDVNAKDVDGNTPLHNLMRSLPQDSSISKKKKLINLFLKYGGNLHEPCPSLALGTVVHVAAIVNHTVPFLTFLIEKGADRTFADIRTVTFMHCIQARKSVDQVTEVLKFLFVRECARKFQFTDNLLRFIESDEKFIDFQKSCKNELRILKDQKLTDNDSISLFTALTTNERDLANLYRHDPSRTIGITDSELERFPIYGNDLVRNHKKAVAILDAEILICDFLTKISKNVLDQNSIDEIVNFVPTQD